SAQRPDLSSQTQIPWLHFNYTVDYIAHSCYRIRILAHRGASPETILKAERGVASNARTRVSKDEDGHALMLRDASQRASAGEAPALASRCDAPQHEGEGAPRILAKRTQRAFWRNEPNRHFGETNPTSILAKRTQAGSMRASEVPTCGCTK